MPRKSWWLSVEFDSYTGQLPKAHLRLLIYAVLGMIAYADHVLGYRFGFSIFYLLPIIIATRNLGRGNGYFISIVGASLWALMDYYHGASQGSQLVFVWNTCTRFTLFIITVMIFDGWEKEKENARTDALTQVSNRLALVEFGQIEIRRCRRYGHPFSLIYVDVDNFKVINDKFGHKAGDRLLVLLSDALRANFRETDLVARLGGDEFAIILIETDAEGAKVALSRVSESLGKIPRVGTIVTLSIGLVTYAAPPDSFDDALKKADEMMYLAKNKGKNCIQSVVIEAPSRVKA